MVSLTAPPPLHQFVFFKIFGENEHLAIITETVTAARSELTYFSILYAVVNGLCACAAALMLLTAPVPPSGTSSE